MNDLTDNKSLRKLITETSLNEIPFIGSLSNAVDTYRKKRIHKFLVTLTDQFNSFSKSQQDELHKIIESEEGKDMLSSFAYNAVNSPSLRVSYALALIYSMYSVGQISETDARFYCSAINGLDDFLIDSYLTLCDLPAIFPSNYLGENAPFDVVVISQEFLNDNPELNISLSTEELFSVVNELINRRLFLPDFTFDRATKAEWTVIFGLNSKSNILKKIFKSLI